MLLLLLSLAFAQDPEQAWLVEDATALRFPDAEVPGPELDANERVTVLFREGDLVRVRAGDEYGWVPSAKITTTAPEGATIPTEPPPEFDMKALEELLKRTEGSGL
jgi:hypothetical protein